MGGESNGEELCRGFNCTSHVLFLQLDAGSVGILFLLKLRCLSMLIHIIWPTNFSACCTVGVLGQVGSAGWLCSLGWSRASFFNPGCVCVFGSGYFCGSYIISIANAAIGSTDSLFVALSHPCCKVTHLIFSLEQETSLQMGNSLVMPLSAPNLF